LWTGWGQLKGSGPGCVYPRLDVFMVGFDDDAINGTCITHNARSAQGAGDKPAYCTGLTTTPLLCNFCLSNTPQYSLNISPFSNFKWLQDHVRVHGPTMCTDVCSTTELWTTYTYMLKCPIHPPVSVSFHKSNHDATHQTLAFCHFSTNNRSLQNLVTSGIHT